MSLRHIQQPKGSTLCGQACVAMLKGITLDDACVLIGHRHGTRTKEILAALDLPPQRLRRVKQLSPSVGRALLKVIWGDTHRSHWVILEGGEEHDIIWDPQYAGPLTECAWEMLTSRGEVPGRVTSFLPV